MTKQLISRPGASQDQIDDAVEVYFEDNPVFSYHHDQAFASDAWSITHNLGYNPSVTVIDTAGTQVEGVVSYEPDFNSLIIHFAAAFSGDAYLS